MVKYDYEKCGINIRSAIEVFRPIFEECGVEIHYWNEIELKDATILVGHLTYKNQSGWWMRNIEHHACGECTPISFFTGSHIYGDETNPKLGIKLIKKCKRKIPKFIIKEFTHYYLDKGSIIKAVSFSLWNRYAPIWILNLFSSNEIYCDKCYNNIIGNWWKENDQDFCNKCKTKNSQLKMEIPLKCDFHCLKTIQKKTKQEFTRLEKELKREIKGIDRKLKEIDQKKKK